MVKNHFFAGLVLLSIYACTNPVVPPDSTTTTVGSGSTTTTTTVPSVKTVTASDLKVIWSVKDETQIETGPDSINFTAAFAPGIGSEITASNGSFGSKDVELSIRETPSGAGKVFFIRMINRSAVMYTTTGLRVEISRSGTASSATIENAQYAVPCHVSQWWERSNLGTDYAATMHGFAYEIRSGGARVKYAGPATEAGKGNWGGRTQGIVRIDGNIYMIPDFWQRQPRKIEVTADRIIFTLFGGTEAFRSGEGVIDRIVVIPDSGQTDTQALESAYNLPDLSESERISVMADFGIARENLNGIDTDAEELLRKYDRWQGASWELKYCDDNPGIWWADQPEGRQKSTLFTLLARGFYYAEDKNYTYSWRDYGDIQWGEVLCSLHYDWVRAAFKHYLRTGNRDALRWGMSAAYHNISTDHTWEARGSTAIAAVGMTNYAGLSRYEMGDHGSARNRALPTHNWAEGLFLAYRVTKDPWILECAVDRAEGVWRFFGGSGGAQWDCFGGETRLVSWPLLILTVAYRETGTEKYWTKAKELMALILREEQRSGSHGYIASLQSMVGNTMPLMNLYSSRAMLTFADTAMAKGEWTQAYTDLLKRYGAWLTTPYPNGPLVPNGSVLPTPDTIAYGRWIFIFAPPGSGAALPSTLETSNLHAPYSIMVSDLLAWLCVNDQEGTNPATGEAWTALFRKFFRQGMMNGAHPGGYVGYLTNSFPTAETKIIGWMQLFNDRSARYLAGRY